MEILTLGEKIRRKRKSLRLTLKDVAGDNVTPAQLSYVESDKCKPSKSLLRYICEKIELDIEYALESESDQARKYCDYFMREYEFYIRRGETEEARAKLEEVEKLSKEYGLDRHMGIVCYKKGKDSLDLNELSTAEYYTYTAMQLFMKLNETNYIAKCYHNLGIIASNRSYYDDAIILFNNALDITQSAHDKDTLFVCDILFNKARVYYYQKNSSACNKTIGYIIDEMMSLEQNKRNAHMICEAALMVSNMEQAEKYIEEAENIYQISGQKEKIEYLNSVRLLLYAKSKRFNDLNQCISKIHIEFINENNIKMAINILEAAKELIESGDYHYANTILNLMEKVEVKQLQGLYKYLKSKLLCTNDKESSINYFISSLEQLDNRDNRNICIEIADYLGSIYKEKKSYSEALHYFKMCAKLYNKDNGLISNIS
ncbi:helix-turn-helix domain protein [Oxobacter pfennigii]|uniref:Helix-turn-helix domain protein n=1 Tax=Oxobacter pfennigii TaxID=36849 RepID=A0A0P8X096_9CLOT|nr:helix-turn-helix transcriptional regulator [Oxobacter pfennigii]KPU44173.1 helix-turn-helix domain protein [Oxobacter pfennigii]